MSLSAQEVLVSIPGSVKSDIVANGSPSLLRFCVAKRYAAEMSPASYYIRRDILEYIEDLILVFFFFFRNYDFTKVW